jgi:anti-anti-sigma factor
MNSVVHYERRRLHVQGEMTIYTCGNLKSALLAELTAHPEANELDLSRVLELDTAGLQLLLTARRHVSANGQELRVVNASRTVAEVLELCRLEALLAPAERSAGAP